MKFEMGKS